MLGSRFIKKQVKDKVRGVLSKYILNDDELEKACEGIAIIAIEIIEIIGIKQTMRLLWYAKKVNLLKFQTFGQEKSTDDVVGKS